MSSQREVEAETGAVENVVEEVFGEEDSAVPRMSACCLIRDSSFPCLCPCGQAPIPKIKVSSFAGAHNTPPRSRRKEVCSS